LLKKAIAAANWCRSLLDLIILSSREAIPADFHEAASGHLGDAQLSPKPRGNAKKDSSSRRSRFQPPDHAGIPPPTGLEKGNDSFGLRPIQGSIDGLGVSFHFVVVAFADMLYRVVHPVHPTGWWGG